MVPISSRGQPQFIPRSAQIHTAVSPNSSRGQPQIIPRSAPKHHAVSPRSPPLCPRSPPPCPRSPRHCRRSLRPCRRSSRKSGQKQETFDFNIETESRTTSLMLCRMQSKVLQKPSTTKNLSERTQDNYEYNEHGSLKRGGGGRRPPPPSLIAAEGLPSSF